MKYFKPIISLFAAVILCCAVTAESVYAKEDCIYKEAKAVMTYIMGDVFADETVTRAEFTGVLVSAMKMYSAKTESPFSDVNDKTEYYREICTAEELGIISSADKFNPKEAITYEQAVKMLVCAVGYDNIAEMEGGYPLGYFNTASRLGLTKGTDNTGDTLTSHDAFVLVYRMLCTTVRISGVKNNAVYYEDTGVSYLESLYRLICEEGVVTANNYNPPGGGGSDKKPYITVNGENYDYDGDSLKMLGKSVYLFHIKDETKAEITVLINNSETEIKKEDISEITADKIFANEDETSKQKKYDIKGARFIYNGQKTDTFSLDNLKGDGSKFVLLDNNDDGRYEYVFVYDWKYLYVDMTDRTSGVISDINNDKESMFIPKKTNTNLHIYDENGKIIERDDIKKYDLVAVAETADGDFALIRKCSAKENGKISEKDSLGNVYINGKKYTVSPYAKRNYADALTVGSECTLFLGLCDDIAAVSNAASKMQYGYMISAVPWEIQSTDDIAIRIYTLGGRIKTFRVEKLKIDGKSGIKANAIISALKGGAPQLIKYKTNEHGELTAVDTAKIVTDFEENENEDDSLTQFKFFNKGTEVTKFTYRSGGQSCMPYFNISSANILSVPSDENIRSASEEDFTVTDRTVLRSGTSYQFEVYDLGENGTAGFVVARGQSLKSNANYMIEKISEGIMPDESVGKVLSIYRKGIFSKVYLGKDEEAQLKQELKAGDIAEITLRSDNSVKYIDLVFSGDDLEPSKTAVSGINYEGLGNISYWYGAIYYTDGTYAYITKTKNGQNFDYSIGNLTNIKVNVSDILLVKRDRSEVQLIKSSELKDYKSFNNENYYIVVRLNSQSPMEVYAYEI